MADDRTLRTSRSIPYPPEQVYAAFASAELLASWWGPEGFTNTFDVCEFIPGGRWAFTMHGPDGTDHPNESRFIELVPGAKVVIHHSSQPVFTLTITLDPDGCGTHLHWDQTFDSAETAQAVERMAGPANEQNLDRLTAALGEHSRS